MHLICYYPYYSCLCTLALPSLLTSSIYLFVFIHICVIFLSSIATESGWSFDSTESRYRTREPTKVSSERRLPSRTTNNTHNFVSQEFSAERDRSIQHGNGYLVEGMVLTCSTHAQQPHHTYVLSKHSGNNMLQ